MKVLNLYAGIGGNRKLWKDVNVTAVEIKPDVAAVYQKLFPNDKVIVGNAHQFLLEHYKEYDFIWSSPPCPTHSRCNCFMYTRSPRYPDLDILYGEIIFLKKWFKGKFCIENVIPYYPALIEPTIVLDRHNFWANFDITHIDIKRDFNICKVTESSTKANVKKDVTELEKYLDIKLPSYAINKRLLLRNCVNPKLGKHILDCAFKIQQEKIM